MAIRVLLALAVAALFYAALPVAGAVMARARWRRFRAAMVEASRYPVAGRDRAGEGRFRFFGSLEAIEGDHRIWIRGGRSSVEVDLRRTRVFLIPDATGGDPSGGPADGEAGLASVRWDRVFSLPEGTPVFVAGALDTAEGRPVFRGGPGAPLLVVIHDCPPDAILARAIGSGRQRNEAMNEVTLPSVGIGSLLLLLLAFTFFRFPEKVSGLVALTAALAPVAAFLPPGFPLYFAYRAAWKRGRRLRAQRDLLRLPLRWFPGPDSDGSAPAAVRATLLPGMEAYAMVRGRSAPGGGALRLDGTPREAVLPPGAVALEAETRLPGRRRRGGARAEELVAFGGYEIEGDRMRLKGTEDPMAGFMLVRGDPGAAARESQQASRQWTALAAVCIGADLAVNLSLLFVLLALLLR